MESESVAGRTSLHESCEGGMPEIVDLLLRVGRADPTVRDQKELSPYDIAFNNRNTEARVGTHTVAVRKQSVCAFTCVH